MEMVMAVFASIFLTTYSPTDVQILWDILIEFNLFGCWVIDIEAIIAFSRVLLRGGARARHDLTEVGGAY